MIFLESGILFALPGDSLLFTAGVFVTVLHLNLFLLLFIIIVATFLGGIVGYFIGTYIEHLHKYSLFRKILSKEHIDKAHKFFKEHGLAAIILSRFVPVVRTFTPIVAGIAEMDFKEFVRYSLVGSFLWSTIITLAGYFLGRHFPGLRHYISFIILLVILGSTVPLAIAWLRSRKKGSQG